MNEDGLEHKLAAVLYADVAGYSRLTGADELGTHRQLSSHLDLLETLITEHAGRVVHYAGDAVLAEFKTAKQALRCAVESQKALAEKNRDIPPEQKVEFRFGVNLGDVIVDRGDIYGNGVNVAARLESLADPGGICISETIRAVVGNQLPLRFKDIGRQVVKNIDEPVHAHHVVFHPEPSQPLKTGITSPSTKATRKRYFLPSLILLCAFSLLGILLLAGYLQSPPSPTVSTTAKTTATKSIPDIEPEMVQIPAGSFWIGSPDNEVDRSPDEKQKQVSVSAFQMSKYETTFEQYDIFARATVRTPPEDSGWGRGNRPVIFVSWQDATAYAQWLAEETGKKYRLPTEAEWEYAARAGTTTPYYTGDSISIQQANFNRSLNQTATVGGYTANAWGLHDMHGNVAEWTCSTYSEQFNDNTTSCSAADNKEPRSLRGGAWYGTERWQRSASRYARPPDDALYLVGFRLVLDIQEQSSP